MYDIISGIIDHSWISTNAGEQQYIYYICGALIIVLMVTFIDLVRCIFRGFIRR